MPTNKSAQKGCGGIKTYDFVKNGNDVNGCTAFVSESTMEKVQDVKKQFTGQQSGRNKPGAVESSVFQRAKKLRRLLNR